jgi:hypothetical protein
VRFVGNGDAAFGFELEGAFEEANALVVGKGILPAVGVDKAGGESFGGGDLLTERFKVRLDSLPEREDLRDELQTVLPEQGAKPLPILRRWHLALDSPISGCLEFREKVLPLACDAPKVAI